MSTFIGKDGFNWWMGRIEDTADPLKIGRCRVRIFGWHSDNKAKVPTDALPWCMPVNATNGSKSFSSPLEGDYVTGFFGDGPSGQMPIMLGVLPGIPGMDYVADALSPIKTDLPKGQVAGGVGQPTTAPLARGVTAGTAIAMANANLAHACDFRFELNMDIGLGTLVNPVTAIQNAIKAGKNRAAEMTRFLISQINDGLRLLMKGIILALGFDPTGQVSISVSYAKDLFRKVNEITKKIAEKVENISFVVNMIKDVQQIIDYLNSLPAKFKAIIKECILKFLAAIQNIIDQFKAIPGAVGGNLQGILDSLQKSTDDTSNSISDTSYTANTTPSVAEATQITDVVTNPDETHAETLSTYITVLVDDATASMNDVVAAAYDPNGMESP
jgi:hypothetical protein